MSTLFDKLSHKLVRTTHNIVFDGLSEPPVLVAGQDVEVGHLAIVVEVSCPLTDGRLGGLPAVVAGSVKPDFCLSLVLAFSL